MVYRIRNNKCYLIGNLIFAVWCMACLWSCSENKKVEVFSVQKPFSGLC